MPDFHPDPVQRWKWVTRRSPARGREGTSGGVGPRRERGPLARILAAKRGSPGMRASGPRSRCQLIHTSCGSCAGDCRTISPRTSYTTGYTEQTRRTVQREVRLKRVSGASFGDEHGHPQRGGYAQSDNDRLRSTFAPSSKPTRRWTSNPGTGARPTASFETRRSASATGISASRTRGWCSSSSSPRPAVRLHARSAVWRTVRQP